MHKIVRIAAILLFPGFIALVLFQGHSAATSGGVPSAQEHADSDIDLSGVKPKLLEAGDPLGVILYAYKR